MNALKITVFFIFFSHINIHFSQNNKIIPEPYKQTIKQGFFYSIESPEIITESNFNSAATLLKDALKKLNFKSDKKSKNIIKFIINKNLDIEEYTLSINPKEIQIEASSNLGALHAFQSLNQLILFNNKKGVLKIQSQIINDSPRFKYRGMHLDVGRHMFS